MKDINTEVEKLLSIQRRVEDFNRMRTEMPHIAFVSEYTYHYLLGEPTLNSQIFILIPDEIIDYFKEDCVMVQDGNVYVVR